ncbi:hypothetical protein BJ875DRAFT_464248 [Amylocarpus encephaloides]|uniref:CorA-like transporter domain-containing protein n=1 Tax=Amylocarpus encephaloides TaxID=45428 RepID=A0A9P7YGX5_9HELO|nr:hypothetical protein BJ875DRAFT_464248 [Amylocarpus encephaloides]
MAYLLDDLKSLEVTIERKAHDLFKGKPGKAPLQVTRISRGLNDENGGKGRDRLVTNEDVWDAPRIEELKKNTTEDYCQIFTIRHDRSWTTLNIQREVFEYLLSIYGIFASFWKCMFTFGRKSVENEFQFPEFKRRRTQIPGEPRKYSRELSYMLRRVENNGRGEDDDDLSWSIRQTAVYHKFPPDSSQSSATPKANSLFVLVAPSANAETRYHEYLADATASRGVAVFPENIHRLLVEDSIKGWGAYMADLNKRLSETSSHILLTEAGTPTGSTPLARDFSMNFQDRQRLKMLEDKVIDLQVILPQLLDTVTELSHSLRSIDIDSKSKYNTAENVLIFDAFAEYIRELERNVHQAKILKKTAKSTTQLLSDLLAYEEAVALKELTKRSQDEAIALKELTRKSQEENKSMRYLAERSTKDAAAVKILTVITLIYLPTTIVANFFSTEFVQTNPAGHMTLSKNFWLLFAIAIPLTLVTILLWWGWVHLTSGPDLSPSPPPEYQRQFSFRIMGRKSGLEKEKDLEAGKGVGLGLVSPITLQGREETGLTWDSSATTIKDGRVRGWVKGSSG